MHSIYLSIDVDLHNLKSRFKAKFIIVQLLLSWQQVQALLVSGVYVMSTPPPKSPEQALQIFLLLCSLQHRFDRITPFIFIPDVIYF